MSDDEVLPYPGRSAGDVDIEGGTIESLNRDVRTDETDSELDEEMQNMEVKRLEQALGLRETFFWFGVASASVVVLASCIVAVWLTETRQMTSAIAVAFFTGVAVEVLGIVAIIANYLFPKVSGEPTSSTGGLRKK